jgi:hypothetical protein
MADSRVPYFSIIQGDPILQAESSPGTGDPTKRQILHSAPTSGFKDVARRGEELRGAKMCPRP